MTEPRPAARRPRVDPARLLLGLSLLVLAAAYVLRETGDLHISRWVLAGALPAALLVTATVAVARHRARRHGHGDPPEPRSTGSARP